MIGSEEGDTVVVVDIPTGLHDVGEGVGASPYLLEVVAPAGIIVDEQWGGLRTNGLVGVLVVEEELGKSHVGGNVRDGAIGGDEFLDRFLRHDDYGSGS